MPRRHAATGVGRVDRPGWTRQRAMICGALLVTVVTLGLAGCSSSSAGIGRLTVDGQVQVTVPHGVARLAHSGDLLRSGDQIQVLAGEATVRVLTGGFLQLRMGTNLTVGRTSRLVGGAVLIEPAGRALQVSAQEATLVVPAGVAQLAVGAVTTGLVAKVYQAKSELDLPGNPPTPIAAPRQVSLTPATLLPVQASPLVYQDNDPWDHLYLADAEALSTQIGAAATGFNAQVPANEGNSAGFYQQLLPALVRQPDFASAFAAIEGNTSGQGANTPVAKPGDYLIASVIALRGTHGSFANRLNGELLFFGQGAPWGFVAYDQGVTNLTGVLNDVLAAIGRAALPFTGAPASRIAIGPPPTTPASGARTTRPQTPTATSPTTLATPTPGRQATTTPTTVPPLLALPVPVLPGPLGSILNPLLDPLIQALNNILAGKG